MRNVVRVHVRVHLPTKQPGSTRSHLMSTRLGYRVVTSTGDVDYDVDAECVQSAGNVYGVVGFVAHDAGDVGGHMSASASVDVADVGADVEVDVVAPGVADVADVAVADVAVAVAADVVVVLAAAADSTLNASGNASGGAAGETFLRCPWRPRVRVVVARQREADSGSGRWDMIVGADRRWGRGKRR